MALQNDVDEVVEFLLSPFKDITNKAREALNSAGNDDGKLGTTAEALTREGRRALNRLEPLCDKVYRQHGTTFTSSIKSNGKMQSGIVFSAYFLCPFFLDHFSKRSNVSRQAD